MDSTFAGVVWDCADDTGCVSFDAAMTAAMVHGLTREFLAAYGRMMGQPVDAGELLVWLGY